MEAGPAAAIDTVFRECLIPLCERFGLLVIDGGTDAGVMALMGRARAAARARFPLLGVAARGTVNAPGALGRPERAALEPNHSHFLLVPGDRWGDEVRWISAAATCLSAGHAELTLVAGGGKVTERDVAVSLEAGRPTLLLVGSGGAADRIASGVFGAAAPAGLLHRVAIGEAGVVLGPLVQTLLAAGSPPPVGGRR